MRSAMQFDGYRVSRPPTDTPLFPDRTAGDIADLVPGMQQLTAESVHLTATLFAKSKGLQGI